MKPIFPTMKSHSAGAGQPRLQNWGLGLLLVAATFLAYWPALSGNFVWDDDYHLTKNPCIIGPIGFKGIWTSNAAVYYPLVLTSFWVQHAIWGLNPLPYHLVNIAMQAACAVLLWRVLRRLDVRPAWFGAALWALHPVQTESVAWITELKNTQSCLFYLLTIWFFLKWLALETSTDRQRIGRGYMLALLCAALAITSKTSTVMLPVILGLCWWWKTGRWRWRNGLWLIPFFLISAAASIWTIRNQKYHIGAMGPEWMQSWPERMVVAGKIIWFYLGKLLWPHPLIFLYPRWKIDASHLAAYLPALAAMLVLFILWLNRNGQFRPLFFAYAYFLVSLFPVLDFFNVYFFRYSFVGDHFQYLASIGPVVLAGAGLYRLCRWFKLRLPFLEPVLGGMLLALLGLLTWRECGTYADLETLWRTTIARNPNAFLAYNNLGLILSDKGQVGAAIADFQKALEINPDFIEAHNNLGNALLKAGQINEALEHFNKAVAITPNSAVSHYNFGNTLLQAGQLDGAIVQFQKALALQADYPEARNNLGVAFEQSGRPTEALEQYQAALALNPGYSEAHYNVGNMFARQGRPDEAIAHYQKAVELKPDYVDARYSLATTLDMQGRLSEAAEQYRAVIQLEPNYADAHGNLANVLAAQGRLEEAVREYQRTLELLPNSAQAHFKYGQALQAQHDDAGAKIEYEQALALEPKHGGANLSLAWLLATCPEGALRDGKRAVELARQAEAQSGGESPQVLDTLAAAYAEAGRYGEAVATAKRALELSATRNNQPLAEGIQLRLKLYEANTPYHEKP